MLFPKLVDCDNIFLIRSKDLCIASLTNVLYLDNTVNNGTAKKRETKGKIVATCKTVGYALRLSANLMYNG